MLGATFRVSALCCSNIRENDWWGTKLITCYVKAVGINDPDCTDVRIDITAFSVEGIKGLRELPSNVGKRFPNLIIFDAGSCAITKLSKANFANLTKLKNLFLGYNQITEIPDGVFDDLTSLVYLAMGE